MLSTETWCSALYKNDQWQIIIIRPIYIFSAKLFLNAVTSFKIQVVVLHAGATNLKSGESADEVFSHFRDVIAEILSVDSRYYKK